MNFVNFVELEKVLHLLLVFFLCVANFPSFASTRSKAFEREVGYLLRASLRVLLRLDLLQGLHEEGHLLLAWKYNGFVWREIEQINHIECVDLEKRFYP